MTIGAISLHFSCFSGPETHQKCNEIAPIFVVCYINIGNVPNIYVTKYDDWFKFIAFFVSPGPESHQKCNEISPIFELCYINIGNVPNIYVTKYDDWFNFIAFFVNPGPESHQKFSEISPIFVLWYISIGNVPNIYVTKYDDWCNFVAFLIKGLERTKNATKLHQSSYFVTYILETFPKFMQQSTTIGAISLHISCVSGPETL